MKKWVIALFAILSSASTNFAEQKVRWVTFKSNLLNLTVSVPSDWSPVKAPKMLAFRYDDLVGGTAGAGILKSDQIKKIDEAAEKELQTPGHSADWSRSDATVGGMRAIEITGTDLKDPTKRFEHYYIETPNGVYLVQCQGTGDLWTTFDPIFTKILTSLKFL